VIGGKVVVAAKEHKERKKNRKPREDAQVIGSAPYQSAITNHLSPFTLREARRPTNPQNS
jgi:hypothetical protein